MASHNGFSRVGPAVFVSSVATKLWSSACQLSLHGCDDTSLSGADGDYCDISGRRGLPHQTRCYDMSSTVASDIRVAPAEQTPDQPTVARRLKLGEVKVTTADIALVASICLPYHRSTKGGLSLMTYLMSDSEQDPETARQIDGRGVYATVPNTASVSVYA